MTCPLAHKEPTQRWTNVWLKWRKFVVVHCVRLVDNNRTTFWLFRFLLILLFMFFGGYSRFIYASKNSACVCALVCWILTVELNARQKNYLLMGIRLWVCLCVQWKRLDRWINRKENKNIKLEQSIQSVLVIGIVDCGTFPIQTKYCVASSTKQTCHSYNHSLCLSTCECECVRPTLSIVSTCV